MAPRIMHSSPANREVISVDQDLLGQDACTLRGPWHRLPRRSARSLAHRNFGIFPREYSARVSAHGVADLPLAHNAASSAIAQFRD